MLTSPHPTSTADFGIIPDVAKDQATTNPDGSLRALGIDGVQWLELRSHVDHRGVLFEGIDTEHPFWSEPVVFSYVTSLRPGVIKGFAVHHHQIDRQICVSGSVRFVLRDGRENSPTFGVTAQVYSTPEQRGALRIPAGVWHAIHNWTSDTDAVVVNYPTDRFCPENPDKFRTDPLTGAVEFDFTLTSG